MTGLGGRAGRSWTGYAYVAPALLLVGVVVYGGIAYNAYVSSLRWNGISPTHTVVGLANYQTALADPVVRSAYLHAALFAAVTISTQMLLGLGMALLLSRPSRLNPLFTAVLFLPVVMAPAAVSTAFRQILAPDGQLNAALAGAGLSGLRQAWLSDPRLALLSLAAVNIWQWTGLSFVLYQAALTQISVDHLEAAQIDGASLWRTVRHIVVPQLRGTHVTLVVLGLIGSIKTFDLVFLTTGGGPARATELPATYIYQQTVERFNAGYGATLSMLLLAVSVLVTVLQRLPAWVRRRA
ncbi:MAG: sugar ABC transporter permease [Actinomycetia bacterium]|nr:sugar ABC transporter permease [Actinomycetes bacterium]